MKLPFLHHANSTSPQPRATIDSESAVFFSRNSYTLSRPLISFLVRFLDVSRLILRLFLNGYRPQIRQGGERNLNGYWYVYYPLSGVSKVLASEAEIQQWLESRQEI